jgi:hypothetical protein
VAYWRTLVLRTSSFFVGFANLKLNLTNVIGVTDKVGKEIVAKQPELPF